MPHVFSFDEINKIFEERRAVNRQILNQRKTQIYEEIPEYKRLDTSESVLANMDVNEILSGNTDYVKNVYSSVAETSARKKALLTEHGYSADYLDAIYTCPDCKDTGYINENRCHCYKNEVLRLMYKQSNLDKLLEKENFSTFNINYYSDAYVAPNSDHTPRDIINNILEYCHHYIDNFGKEHGNILFYGQSGVGKTFLSNCIAKELLDSGYSVIYLTSHQLFDILETKAFRKEEMKDIDKSIISMLYTCDLLIIDDLGTELINNFTESQLFSCIQERLLANVGTIISTNFSFNDIKNNYNERIFSRLTGNYKLIKIAGDDIRIKKALI